MLVDKNPNLRNLAVSRIIKARKCDKTCRRQYSLPKVNFEARHYCDLISWESHEVRDYDSENSGVKFFTSYSKPPLPSDFQEEILKRIAETSKVPDEIYELPCHNQRVERAIKLVTEIS